MKRNFFIGFVCIFQILNVELAFTQIRIVCMGNSITQGTTNPNLLQQHTSYSWRYWLWVKLDSAAMNVDMVGYYKVFFNEDASNMHETPTSPVTNHVFPRNHEAYWGINTTNFLKGNFTINGEDTIYKPWETSFHQDTLYNFSKRINHPIRGYTPDIALLHLGTNDNNSELDVTEHNIKEVIDILREKNPVVTIFLARLITGWSAINNRVDQMAAEKAKSGSPIVIVDLTKDFINDPSDTATTMTYDWVHPNVRGQHFIAKRWFDAIVLLTDLLNKPVIVDTLYCSNVTTNSCRLNWKVKGTRLPEKYNIFVNNVLYSNVQAGNDACDIKNLLPNTNYVINIASVYNNGIVSVPSPIMNVKTITKKDQVIHFPSIPDPAPLDTTIELDVNASSGLPIVYTLVSGDAILNENVLTITGVGKVVVHASQSGDSLYNAAPNVVITFNVVTAMPVVHELPTIYPNPAADFLHVKSMGGSTVQGFNMLGKMVFKQRIVNDDQLINIQFLEEGVYLIKFLNHDVCVVKRLVVRR
jgi:lysophospholipase L1-like esterase